MIDINEWNGLYCPDFADEGQANGVGHIVKIDEDFFSAFDFCRITDKLFGKFINTWVVHKIELLKLMKMSDVYTERSAL